MSDSEKKGLFPSPPRKPGRPPPGAYDAFTAPAASRRSSRAFHESDAGRDRAALVAVAGGTSASPEKTAVSSRPRSVPCGAFRTARVPSVASTPFSNVAVSIERPSVLEENPREARGERPEPRPGRPSGSAGFGGVEVLGHGELAKPALLEIAPRSEARGARRARLPRPAGPRSSRAGTPRGLPPARVAGCPDASTCISRTSPCAVSAAGGWFSLAKHEEERVARVARQTAPVRLFEPGHGFTPENEAVRLQDGAARRLHPPVA